MLDSLYPAQPSQVILDVAPTYNALASLVTVADAMQSPGIGEWPVRTRNALSPAEWEKHRLIASWIGIEALSNVIDTAAALASFPVFVRSLAERDARLLRAALLHWIVASPSSHLAFKPTRPHVDDSLSLLESEQAFFSLHDLERKSEDDISILRQLFDYMLDPPALQSLVTDYLDHFWHEYLKQEWERTAPELEAAVAGFEGTDTTGMSHFEVIETITHRNLRGVCRPEVLRNVAALRFIPSFHCGPYILRMSDSHELRIVFDANRLLTVGRGTGGMDTAYVIDRMKALGDETRLAIVRLLKKRGELGTHEIITELDLSRSAASRHLRQLYANNIVVIRTDEDGTRKYYRLNAGLGEEMQRMFAKLLP